MRFILDCSVTLSWCFESENSAYATRILGLLESATAVVPSLWSLEVVNGLVTGEKRGKIQAGEVADFLKRLAALNIVVEPMQPLKEDLWTYARQFKLSSYDAFYLMMAIRLSLPLASADQALLVAAKTSGVVVL